MVKIKKKWIILGLIIVSIVAYNIYSRCIFRFQNFKTGEKLDFYLKEKFPIGSNAEPMIQLLKKGGATCEFVDKKNYDIGTPKNTKEYWFCSYGHWEFSLHLLVGFTIDIYKDVDGKIIKFYIGRHPEVI